MKNKFSIIISTIILSLGLVGITLATILFPSGGGLGTGIAPNAGQIPIGYASGTYTPSYLTAGTGIGIATSSGAITISFNSTDYPTFTYLSNNYYGTNTISTNYVPTSTLSSYLTSAFASVNYLATGTLGVSVQPYNANTALTNSTMTGLWHGTAIGSLYGGTGQDTSGWSGIPKITSGTWATSSNIIIRTPTFNFIDSTTTSKYSKLSTRVPSAATITEIGCWTDTGSTTLAFYEAGESTPNASSSTILGSLVCDTDSASSTTFSDSSIAARGYITALMMAVSGATNTTAYVSYTITP